MYAKSSLLCLAFTTAYVTAQGMAPPDQDGLPPNQIGFGGPQRQPPPKEVRQAQSRLMSYYKGLTTQAEWSSAEAVLATAVPESVLQQYNGQIPPEVMSSAPWYQAIPPDVKTFMSSVASEVASIAAPIVSAAGGPGIDSTMNTYPAAGPAPGSGPKDMGPKATAPTGPSAPMVVSSTTTSVVTPSSSEASSTTTSTATTSTSTSKNGTAKNAAALMHSPGVGGIFGSVVGVAGVVFGGAMLL